MSAISPEKLVSKSSLTKVLGLLKSHLEDTYQVAITAGAGLNLDESGNLTLTYDHTLFKVVSSVPSAAPAAADENKIHLVAVADTNEYDEYIYVKEASKWEKIGTANLDTNLSGLNSTVEDLQGRMTEAESDIESLEGDMTQAQSDISQAQSDIAEAESDISSLESSVSDLESKVEALEESIGEDSDISNRLTTAESEINSLKGKVGTLETWKGTVDALDIANRLNDLEDYLTATEAEALFNSIFV